MFYLKNLATTEVHRGEPWGDLPRDPVPPQAITDKVFRTQWMTDPKTVYPAYSLFEGVNSNLRLKGPSATEEEGNPPCRLWGIVADYDLPLGQAEIDAGLARMNIKPTWLETSLSGNLRALWIFERPVLLHSYPYALHILKKICDFLPLKAMPGLDEPALLSPDRYFTTGTSWIETHAGKVPDALVQNFLVEISAKFEWFSEGPVVPLEVVAAECAKKFTRFREWRGAFELGATGPSFWVDGSLSQNSAIVRETGISTFAGHATKNFYNWSEIIGAEIVQKFKARQMGEAVRDCFFDEKSYFSKLPDGSWAVDPKENIALHLKVNKGLSDRVRKGEHASEVETALAFIQRNNRIKTAASFAFYKEGLIEFNGARCLNLHTKKALAPAPGPAVWGPEGNFIWLSRFLDTLFSPKEALPYFLSWFKYFYTSCYLREPRSGHALFIAGGVSVGKTFLSRAVVSQLCGGFAEASALLMGSDNFNSESFDASTWVIDDGSVSLDFRSHKRFSEQIKRVIANPTHRCNGKFAKAVQVQWQGRCIITLNVDEESLRLLPDLDISIREKIMLLRTVAEPAVQFLSQPQMEDMLRRELPYLARFLLDMEYPPHTIGPDPRFFCVAFHEAGLVSNANHSSNSAAFAEILEEFLKEYFQREPDADAWTGTGLALCKQILSDPAMVPLMRSYNSATIGRIMSVLAGKGVFDIKIGSEDFSRGFVISRGARYPKKHVNGARVPQAQNSVFSKV